MNLDANTKVRLALICTLGTGGRAGAVGFLSC